MLALSQSAAHGHPLKLVVAELLCDDVDVEQAVGVLMVVYDLDADNAVELLNWGAQALGVTVRLLARRLTGDLEGPALGERADLRSTCDDVLFAVADDPTTSSDSAASARQR